MANITRIKAKDHKSSAPTDDQPVKPKTKTSPKSDKKPVKTTPKEASKKPLPKGLSVILAPFIFIAKPFRAFGRYVKASWVEIRQVRWPNRKLTWKMTLSVIIYVLIFAAVIMLLDALFTFIFNKLLGV